MTAQDPLPTTPASGEFRRLIGAYDLIPLVRTIHVLPDPVLLYRETHSISARFILESAKGGEFSYVGGGRIDEVILSGSEESVPLNDLRRRLNSWRCYPHPDLRNFSGGYIGFLSYDLVRSIEILPAVATDPLSLPDIHLILPEFFVEIDHQRECCRIVVLVSSHSSQGHPDKAQADAVELLDSLEASVHRSVERRKGEEKEQNKGGEDEGREGKGKIVAHTSPDEFARSVARAIDYIYAGDIFQVNLSVRFSRPFRDDPFRLYRVLREINPAPYMAFIEFDDYAIVSSSPELLLKVDGRKLSTRPIAGTRKRGKDEEEDRRKVEELINNEKERAEHLMLVDLERNDLGRVSEFGSVHVDEFMSIEKYSHVIHIVSNVRGRLAAGNDVIDAIGAVFPGGTITGAPKIRSMEIIEELEPERRGIYTGSIGWIGLNGDAELNIAIRTILVSQGEAYVQAGAGIVADSVPAFEYKESLRKAEAMFSALRRLEGEE